jgi:hypothetical protein
MVFTPNQFLFSLAVAGRSSHQSEHTILQTFSPYAAASPFVAQIDDQTKLVQATFSRAK